MDFLQQIIPDKGGTPVLATRFAPSPNGPLHLGHAFAALCAHDYARTHGGVFRLRIEDIDGTRSRTEHIDGIMADLQWLSLGWDGPVQFQSHHVERYAAALEQLKGWGLVYRCRCTRSDIATAVKAHPVPHGPDGPLYPGTCRERAISDDEEHCWRLDMAHAVKVAGPLAWTDLVAGEQHADLAPFGDVILWRKDAHASYHLAATVDDAVDGIGHVVRGRDLFAYTAIHRLLQRLLDLPEPLYWHHALLIDATGGKLAKSRSSSSLAALRQAGEGGVAIMTALRRGEAPAGISFL